MGIQMKNADLRMCRFAACAICIVFRTVCLGQESPTERSKPAQNPTPQTSPSSLPEAPSAAQSNSAPAVPADEQQTKRIMGVLPNFRSVSAGATVAKETTREKLMTATEDNFDYTSLFFAGFIAADSFVTKATPEFHQGAAGYARYYWHSVADQSVENYFVELIVPAITHEDSRYFAMGKEGGGVLKRAKYSVSRVLVTRTDSGKRTFNYSEIEGSAAAVSISNFYYPTKEQTVHNGLRNWGLDITYDAVTFVFHEFWPDIRHAVFGRNGGKAVASP
jgi:hypothetical protein